MLFHLSRGGTLEHLVCYLIEDPEMLWNSADEAALRVGDSPPTFTLTEGNHKVLFSDNEIFC